MTSSDLNSNLSYNDKRAKIVGSRYTPANSEQEFSRDVDKLFVQFANLRKSLYRRLSKSVPSDADRDDLISYINETFVKLTKEYDPTSGVDFPGYIYKMLTMRTKALYVRPTNREHERQIATEDEELLGQLEGGAEDEVLEEDLEHLIKFVSSKVHLDDDDKYIMTLIADGLTDVKISRILAEQYEITPAEAKEKLADIKEMLSYVLVDYK